MKTKHDDARPGTRGIRAFIESYGRAHRLRKRLAKSRRQAATPIPSSVDVRGVRPVFLIGCGRSGTTLLGDLIMAHPEMEYLLEPYHYWAAIDIQSDASHIYHDGPGRCIMDEQSVDHTSVESFRRIFLPIAARAQKRFIVEKTPINTYRTHWLDALAPDARFICLLRDGVDVAHSIARLAERQAAKIAGKRDMNFWWGVSDAKWRNMSRDGVAAGCLPDQVDLLHGDLERGAYEWILSHQELEKRRSRIEDRLMTLKYVDLTENPAESLRKMCEFLDAPAPDMWLEACSDHVEAGRGAGVRTLELPAVVADEFNRWQERLGFEYRAVGRNP